MRFPLIASILAVFIVSGARAVAGEVTGPFANRMSSSDVAQIKAAISNERHVSHNVKKIEAVRPDKVAIQTASRTAVDEDTTYDFMVYKRSGAWQIDSNSIQISIEQRDLRTNGPTFIR